MQIEEALRAYLLTIVPLTNLINQRILADELSDITLPAVTYFKVSDIKDHTLTGQLNLERPYIQFTVFAKTKTSARAISELIKTALCDFTGTMSGIFIQKIELQNELSNLETQSGVRIFTESLEFQVNYERN